MMELLPDKVAWLRRVVMRYAHTQFASVPAPPDAVAIASPLLNSCETLCLFCLLCFQANLHMRQLYMWLQQHPHPAATGQPDNTA